MLDLFCPVCGQTEVVIADDGNVSCLYCGCPRDEDEEVEKEESEGEGGDTSL